ncbi:MAG: transaldolase [Streptococcus constellatus]
MVKTLSIKVYSDGAVLDKMLKDLESGLVSGFTTNPSLMKKAGITSYVEFAKEVLTKITEFPVSFEVFSDEMEIMEKEAEFLASLGENVYVKIPVINSRGESTLPLIDRLTSKGIKVNVTAVFTVEQVKEIVPVLKAGLPSIVSVFAGRIADTGVDPILIMKESLTLCHQKSSVELLWASPREAYNIYQADELGVDIITCTPDLIQKLSLNGKDLYEYSLETVQMFLRDSTSLGFKIIEE